MDTSTALEKAAAILQPWALATATPEPNRLDVVIERGSLIPAVKALVKARWGFFSALTGLDQPPSGDGEPVREGCVEVLYHFCSAAAVVTLRVSVPYSDAKIDSICEVIPSATLYERELIEMFGVECTGTPNTERLLLSDDWPEGVYPLRKSFTGFQQAEGQEANHGSAA